MSPSILGRRYRDRVTGYEGTATAVTHYLTGCSRVGLERRRAIGKAFEVLVFDIAVGVGVGKLGVAALPHAEIDLGR